MQLRFFIRSVWLLSWNRQKYEYNDYFYFSFQSAQIRDWFFFSFSYRYCNFFSAHLFNHILDIAWSKQQIFLPLQLIRDYTFLTLQADNTYFFSFSFIVCQFDHNLKNRYAHKYDFKYRDTYFVVSSYNLRCT